MNELLLALNAPKSNHRGMARLSWSAWLVIYRNGLPI